MFCRYGRNFRYWGNSGSAPDPSGRIPNGQANGSLTRCFLEEDINLWEKGVYLRLRADKSLFFFIEKSQISHSARGPPVPRFIAKRGQRLKEERMKTKHTDSVQNRFTAYLMAALGNTRRKYWERKYRLQGMEAAREDLLERNYTDFEEQYRAYIRENTDFRTLSSRTGRGTGSCWFFWRTTGWQRP